MPLSPILPLIHSTAQAFSSGIDTLGELIYLQSSLRHVGILEEIKGHPNEMSLDLVQLLANILCWQELVENVTSLDAFGRKECVIIIETFH